MDTSASNIAQRLRMEREARNWSLAALAEQSHVSKAMISKIERAESSPTTQVLGRLCGAFGITLSTFLIRAEGINSTLVRAARQPAWTDPETGMVRHLVSPNAGGQIEIVRVDLPADAKVVFPASIYAVFQQTIWVTGGQLTLTEGGEEKRLDAGDCLELGTPSEVTFCNQTTQMCRYVVAACKRG